ncbi:MAG: BTAD domain-containing putative transcriptional regulator [Candidatus Tumulicola sp.]
MNDLCLHFRFLGDFAIQAETRWYRGPSAKKGRELIQYLGAYPRRVATGDELAEAFWPGLDLETVAHRIHLAASGARTYLRGVLGGADAIECVSGGYAWGREIRVSSDADEFLELCRSKSSDVLQSAAELYAGEFLAGETADWLQPLRIRCASAYSCAMDRLAEEAVSSGDFGKALVHGLQLIAAEPAHEGATCLVMRCFAALGQRARAIERYETLANYLKRHLGIGPTQQTMDLARQLRGNDDLAP